MMLKKLLVGYDGSDGSKQALEEALKLAVVTQGEVWALWVRGSLPHYPATLDEIQEEKEAANGFFEQIMKEATALAGQFAVPIHCEIRSGHPAKTLVDFAQKGGFDLIVLGHRGHSGLWGGFLGHTTDKVSENAHCSVLIVR